MLDLGSRRGRGRVVLTDAERAFHLHVMGATGTGKSKLLEHMIRQDITRGRGLCLIDPHGTLSDEIEKWSASRGLGRVRRIHLIKPGSPDWTAGFNPLRVDPNEALAVRVDAMVAACAQVWGGQDMNQTPRLKKVLRALFFALAARNLTLAEALFLLRSGDPEGTRRALTSGLPDPVFEFVWGELNALSRKDFAEYTESTISRLAEFLSSPAVRLMIGQQSTAIDFRKVMDAGEIVLVNLGSRGAFSYENARVVGSLIINDLFLTALGRDEKMARSRPFSLFIDEAYDFLSTDVERILDQTRKFGLHAVLSHQRLGQLEDRGVYSAVMSNTRTKVIFGGLSDDDAGVMAREILRGDVDLEKPKHVLDKSVVVEEVPHWFESGSWAESTSSSRSTTESYGRYVSEGAGSSEGEGYRSGDGPDEQVSAFTSQSSSISSSYSESRGSSESFSHSRSDSRSWTEGRVNRREIQPTAVYSLEEQLHLGQLKLRSLPDRHAIVKRSGKRAEEVRIAEVRQPLSSLAITSRFRDAISLASPYVGTTEAAEAELAARQSSLGAPLAKAASDAEFWSDE